MAEVQYNFRGAVWDYTYSSGPGSDVVFFQSPQRLWSDRRKSVVLRQVNSDAQNKVWVNKDASLVRRCHGNDGSDFPTLTDAHGLLIQDGFAVPADPAGERGALVPYHRGERVWIEQSLHPSDADDIVPVVSIDTLHHFTISSRYICFVPQLVRSGGPGKEDRFATLAGPVHEIADGGRRYATQAFFEWPAGHPEKATRQWDRWTPSGAAKPRALQEFRPLDDVDERRRQFRRHWAILSDRLSVALDDDDMDDDDVPQLSWSMHGLGSSSDSSEDTLDRQIGSFSADSPAVDVRSRPC